MADLTIRYASSMADATFYQKSSLLIQTISTTRKQLDEKIVQSNEICRFLCSDNPEEVTEFHSLSETFRPVIWRLTGKIGVRRRDAPEEMADGISRILSVPEFINFSQKLKLFALILSSGVAPEMQSAPEMRGDHNPVLLKPDDNDECIICFERIPNVILPCTHAFCYNCLQQWTFIHEGSREGTTCPICREGKAGSADAWSLVTPPDAQEVRGSITASMRQLVEHCGTPLPQPAILPQSPVLRPN